MVVADYEFFEALLVQVCEQRHGAWMAMCERNVSPLNEKSVRILLAQELGLGGVPHLVDLKKALLQRGFVGERTMNGGFVE